MDRTERLDRIGGYLRALAMKTRMRGKLGLFDHHIMMEDVACRLLNLVYGWQLENLNHRIKNHPGVDLGDEMNRVAVQVTSVGRHQKVADTLRKFEKYDCGKKYDRLIVFIHGDKADLAKELVPQLGRDLPKIEIIDLYILFDAIQKSEEPVQKAVYNYLEQRSFTVPGWVKRMSAVFLGVMILGVLAIAGPHAYKVYRDFFPRYEKCMDWLTMDEAAAVLGGESRVEVFAGGYVPDCDYYEGAALTVLYSNLDDRDRAIRRFTVYAEDIVRDMSPALWYDLHDSVSPVGFQIYNDGWGETGPIYINYVDAGPAWNDAGEAPASVSLKDGADTVWIFDSLNPGENRGFPLMREEDLVVEVWGEMEESAAFELLFELEAPETGYKMALSFLIWVLPDGSIISEGSGIGEGEGSKNYVVMVDTSEPQWSRSFVIDQVLPAKRTVRLPIFIIPDQSCAMTVRIEFETADGEIIEATPLENAEFVVPYYEDAFDYVDGSLLDWWKLKGTDVVYFPFRTVPYVIRDETDS